MKMNQHKLEFTALKFFSLASRFIGLKKAYQLGKILGLLFFYILPIRKKTVFWNLQNAFPELTGKQIKQLAKKNYISFGILIAEILAIPYAEKQEVIDKFCNNSEKLKKDFSGTRGVIIYTAHFGNWEMGGMYAGIASGKPMYVLAKPQSNKYVTRWLKEMREKFGNKSVMLGSSVRELYSLLKTGNLVGIVGDQRGPVEGIRVKFFGKDTACYTGTAEIAIKTRAKIVISFAVRQPDYTYIIETEELIYDADSPDKEKLVREINQKYYTALENAVKRYPDQWFWMHNIWKY